MGAFEELSEKQAAFLASCEERFKGRFQKGDREYDNEYKLVLTPPIQTPWYRRRSFNNQRDNRQQRSRSRSRSRSRGRDDRRDYRDRGQHGWRDDQRKGYERRGYRDDDRRRGYHDNRNRPYDNRNSGRDDRSQAYDNRREHRDRDRERGSSYNDGRPNYYERKERD